MPVRGLPTAARKHATHGSPHVGGQSEDDGEGKVERQSPGCANNGKKSSRSNQGLHDLPLLAVRP